MTDFGMQKLHCWITWTEKCRTCASHPERTPCNAVTFYKTSPSILHFISELNNLSNYGPINYKNMNTCCHSLFPVHLLHAKMINSPVLDESLG